MRAPDPRPPSPAAPNRSHGRRRSPAPSTINRRQRAGLLDPSRFRVAAAALAGGRSRQARRLVAAALVGLAVLVLSAGLANPQATTTVLVTQRAVGAGTVITADDVEAVPWPSDLPTTGLVTDADEAIGERTAVPFDKGAPVTTNALMGPSLLGEARLVLAPLRIDDAGSADLVSAGDHVDVLAAPDDGSPDAGGSASVVATDVRVVATPARTSAAGSSSFLGGGSAPVGSGTILLALDRATAARVAAASAASRLSIVVRAR